MENSTIPIYFKEITKEQAIDLWESISIYEYVISDNTEHQINIGRSEELPENLINKALKGNDSILVVERF